MTLGKALSLSLGLISQERRWLCPPWLLACSSTFLCYPELSNSQAGLSPGLIAHSPPAPSPEVAHLRLLSCSLLRAYDLLYCSGNTEDSLFFPTDHPGWFVFLLRDVPRLSRVGKDILSLEDKFAGGFLKRKKEGKCWRKQSLMPNGLAFASKLLLPSRVERQKY